MTREITEYFRQFTYNPRPEDGTPPCEVVWRRVGEMEIRGSRVYVGDSWSIIGGVDVPVQPGIYEFTAECYSYGTDGRVACLRGLLKGCKATESAEIDEFGVDVASAGVIDADALDAWEAANPDAYDSWVEEFTSYVSEEDIIASFFPCPGAGASMLQISTGFGDGTYKATSLLADGRPVGFEARFLKPNQGYFEDDKS
jgi:hypothetical protein